jgi:hypothetical protein
VKQVVREFDLNFKMLHPVALRVCKFVYQDVRLRNNYTFIITTTTCFDLRPSSGGTNIEYTNGNFAELTTDPCRIIGVSFLTLLLAM